MEFIKNGMSYLLITIAKLSNISYYSMGALLYSY